MLSWTRSRRSNLFPAWEQILLENVAAGNAHGGFAAKVLLEVEKPMARFFESTDATEFHKLKQARTLSS
jgi:hypothetical protein